MNDKSTKYELLTVEEEDLDVVGIYDTQEEAFAAMQEAFAKVADCPVEELDNWLGETKGAGIYKDYARIWDDVAVDGCNHSWRIIRLICSGDCRAITEDSENQNSEWFIAYHNGYEYAEGNKYKAQRVHELRAEGYLREDIHVFPAESEVKKATVPNSDWFIAYPDGYEYIESQFLKERVNELRADGYYKADIHIFPSEVEVL